MRTVAVRVLCKAVSMTAEGTTERVLRLLNLLQQRRTWTARELAEALGVTDRSVRRDIERLRTLGYPVHATAGVGGGYQLGAGTKLPPLLLDDAEATATAVSLRMASGGTIAGTSDAALRALAKLDQVMPPRLRAQVRTLHDATAVLSGTGEGIDADLLVTLAKACRDTVRVRFAYAAAGRDASERTVEPVQMVTTGRRWYLMAFDPDRDDWRTFRLDRMLKVQALTLRFTPRDHPDPVAYVQQSVTAAPYRYHAKVRLKADPAAVQAMIPPHVGRVDPDGDGWCLLTTGADELDWLAIHIAQLGFDTQILEPLELRAAAARLAGRLSQMAAPPA